MRRTCNSGIFFTPRMLPDCARGSKFNCIRFVSQSPFDTASLPRLPPPANPDVYVCDTDSARARPLNHIICQRKRIASHSRSTNLKSRLGKRSRRLVLHGKYEKSNCVKMVWVTAARGSSNPIDLRRHAYREFAHKSGILPKFRPVSRGIRPNGISLSLSLSEVTLRSHDRANTRRRVRKGAARTLQVCLFRRLHDHTRTSPLNLITGAKNFVLFFT